MKNWFFTLYRRLFRTFRGRLAMHYIVVELVVLLVAGLLIYIVLAKQIYQEVDDDLFFEAQQLVQKLAHTPGTQWGRQLQDFSAYYRGVVQLVNREGVILFNVGEELINREKKDIALAVHGAFAGNATVFVSTSSLLRQDNLRVAVMPVRVQQQVVAVIILTRTTRDIQKFFKLLYILGGTLGLLSMIISGVLGYRMAKRSLRPIHEITHAAQAVADGDLSRRLESSTHDEEIQELVHSLNKMFICLEANFNSQKRFVADTSHELRHPITILKGEIEVALMQERSQEDYKTLLKQLHHISERMQHIVNDMLTLAQADAGTLEIVQEKVDLSLLLQEVGQHHLMLFSKRNIHLDMQIADGLEIMGDQHRIERVFYNLLNNAYRYAPSNSTITLAASMAKAYISIQVSDCGIGIHKQNQQHLFERFYRVDDARNTQQGEGAGLGLAICKHIILAHRGSIGVSSEHGQGASFEVKLPSSAINPEFSQRLQDVIQAQAIIK
ncbi:MAG: ATP-binding protein [Mariprofundaceae bacterium]|nr:ATP-binding protein [Mariprofundaceae bacterium]